MYLVTTHSYMYLEVDTFIYVPGSTLDLRPVCKCARGQFMQLATVGPFFWDAHYHGWVHFLQYSVNGLSPKIRSRKSYG